MSFCSFEKNAAMFDTTPIENMFLIEHMPYAPENALRVYLYARMLVLHPELDGSMAGMSKALRLDEDAIYEAFAYWERQQLVQRLSDHPPTYEFRSIFKSALDGTMLADRSLYTLFDFNNNLQKLFGERAIVQDHEFRKASDWLNILGFEQDAVLRMVRFGIETSRSKSPKPASVFKRVDKLAEEWSAQGIRTLEDVERAIADENGVNQTANEVLKRFNLARKPTLDELDCVRRWMNEWHYTQTGILEACARTKASRQPNFAYLDAILQKQLTEVPGERETLISVLRELDPSNAQPTPDQLAAYRALIKDGFAPETVRLAAIQCHRKRRYQFGDVEWTLSEWGKAGVRTPEQAEAYVTGMRRLAAGMAEVFRRAGREKRPSQPDIEWYRAWRDTFPADVMEYAGECAHGVRDAVKYMSAILEAWKAEGVTDLASAKAARERTRPAGDGKGAVRPANPALDYQQRDYRDEDFGENFFVDLSKYAEEDGKA